jgi:hypothetical protein
LFGRDDKRFVSSIKSSIVWPWCNQSGGQYTLSSVGAVAKDGVLRFETSVAIVELEKLRCPLKDAKKRFIGWIDDTGRRRNKGLQECISLSRRIREKYNEFSRSHLNVMMIDRDDETGLCYRKGIAVIRDDDWEMFLPKTQMINLA